MVSLLLCNSRIIYKILVIFTALFRTVFPFQGKFPVL